MIFRLILPAALAAATLFSSALPRATQTNARAQGRRTSAVVFAVHRYEADTTIDPVVILDGKNFTPPPVNTADADREAKQAERFIREYYRPGRRFRLLFGGAEAGAVEVLKYLEPGCVGLDASVRAETSARLGGQVMALATDSAALGAKTNTRRAPTETERASALELARKAFAQNRVAASRLRRMETNNLTAVDTNGDGQSELVGSFVIQGEFGVEESLFLIAEPSGTSHTATLSWFHRGQEADSSYRRLVDILDLDGDGTSEVVAQGIYYESHDYFIYKKQRGTWQVVYQGGGGGC